MVNTDIKAGMFSLSISAGKSDPIGKMYKHHYVLLQCCYQQMKDLMWASSALMIIVMGWDDKPHAPVYAMYSHRQKYICSK